MNLTKDFIFPNSEVDIETNKIVSLLSIIVNIKELIASG